MAKIDIFELVLAAVLSVAIGLSFSLWSMLYAALKPILVVFGMTHIMQGYLTKIIKLLQINLLQKCH